MSIHPTAVVDPRANIHRDAEIGPFAVIDGPVKIGAGTRLMPHAIIMGWTEIGEANCVHSGAVLGDAPQDVSYRGEQSYLRIGDRNVFREGVQVHRGTTAESVTTIGNNNFLMANSHVAHNCRLGNHIILTNNAVLGGHVEVGDRAILSASCAVHQFVRVGRLAMMRGLSATSRDVPPFSIIDWQHTVRGLNVVGLQRAGFEQARIRSLKHAFQILFRKRRNMTTAVRELRGDLSGDVQELLEFIRLSRRGVCAGPKSRNLRKP